MKLLRNFVVTQEKFFGFKRWQGGGGGGGGGVRIAIFHVRKFKIHVNDMRYEKIENSVLQNRIEIFNSW